MYGQNALTGYPGYNPGYMYGGYNTPGSYQPAQSAAGNAPGMSPPTIHAEIIQVDDEAAGAAYPVAANGVPQMMIKRDDKEIYIKTAYANGSYDFDVYVKRTPATAPSPYITREEFEKFASDVMNILQPAAPERQGKQKKEASGNE